MQVLILENQLNGESSIIKDEGDGIISTKGFPDGWRINGSWKFGKKAKKCLFYLQGDEVEIEWKC